ncbi:ricin-type beta-trefoil lectin domain protein [Streptacidiphilus sp. MAP12-33]|uniref:RICIN domain-containing protein n=1 Tax=Streptacidiphilus sp. MAP12-33 TaxID=3156266 RepID=UPI0035174116
MPTRPAARGPRRGTWLAPLRRSRRSAPPAGPAPRADHGLWTVDRIVRVLATACDRDNRGLPVAHAVVVGPEAVRLQLKTPDERPPTGWSAENDGRVWQAPLRRLQSAGVDDSLAEPYPRLVSLGSASQGFVLLNLSQAGGIIGLEGDVRQARRLAQDWTGELGTSPWSRDVRVVRVGFRSGPEGALGSTEAQSLADAEAALADHAGGVLLLDGLPGGRDRERVYTLANDPDGRWSVVVVGRVEHPRWRFTLDAAGFVDTGILDEPVAHRLRDDTTWDTPAADTDDADTPPVGRAPLAGHGAGFANAETAPHASLRRWLVIATAVIACVVGATGVALALRGSPAPTTPVARTSALTGASTNAPPGGGTTAGNPSGATTASQGAVPPTKPTLRNPATGLCLSGSVGTDGTPLVLSVCDGDPSLRWALSPDGTIGVDGLCMDSAWGATKVDTVVQIARCSGNPAQQFSLVGDTIHSKQAKLCLGEVAGGKGVHLFPCDHRPSEVFKRS